MNEFLDSIDKEIEYNKQEIKAFNLRISALNSRKEKWSSEDFEREMNLANESINGYLDNINRLNNQKKSILEIEDQVNYLKSLSNMALDTSDQKLIISIGNEMKNTRNKINSTINQLPEEIKDEIRDKYFPNSNEKMDNDKKLSNLIVRKDAIEKAYIATREEVEDLTDEYMDIVEELETEPWNDIANSNAKQIINSLQIEKNNKNKEINSLEKEEKILNNRINILNKQIEDRKVLIQEANALNMDVDSYNELINKSKNIKLLNKYLEKEGCELVEEPTKAEAIENKEKIKQYIINKRFNEFKNEFKNNREEDANNMEEKEKMLVKITVPAQKVKMSENEILNIKEKVIELEVDPSISISKLLELSQAKAIEEIRKEDLDAKEEVKEKVLVKNNNNKAELDIPEEVVQEVISKQQTANEKADEEPVKKELSYEERKANDLEEKEIPTKKVTKEEIKPDFDDIDYKKELKDDFSNDDVEIPEDATIGELTGKTDEELDDELLSNFINQKDGDRDYINDLNDDNLNVLLNKKVPKIATNDNNLTEDNEEGIEEKADSKEELKTELNDSSKDNNDKEVCINNDNYDYNNFKEIMYNKVLKGLEPEKRDGRKYRASNIQVTEEFYDELHSGNYLYNIVHFIPAVIKAPIQLIRKAFGKLTYRNAVKDRMETIKYRLNSLSEKDLETLYRQYANHSMVEKFGDGVDSLVNERITKYIEQKVALINNDIENKYKELFSAKQELDAIDQMVRRNDVSHEMKQKYLATKAALLDGKIDMIKDIRREYEEANSYLSGGIHGFNENIKATRSKMSYVGFRFAKDYDFDMDLFEKEYKLEKLENQAIKENNAEIALSAFLKSEELLRENTEFRYSPFGIRSTGKKYYQPLATKLNYNNDPFIRDIFTTIAVVGATVSAYNAFHNTSRLTKEQIEKLNDRSDRIAQDNDKIIKGMEARNYQDTLTTNNVLERGALDKSSAVHGGWSQGTQAYRDARASAQDIYTDMYGSTKLIIEDTMTKYSQGAMSQDTAINTLSGLSDFTQSKLQAAIQDSLPYLQQYAKDHSQFDLTGVENTMNYLIQNTNAINEMNDAIIDLSKLSSGLNEVQKTTLSALAQSPANVRSTLFNAASAAALATRVAATAKRPRPTYYGNNVIDRLDNYMANKNKQKTM